MATKELLAAAIDSLAKSNFNTVYINVWSRGYPLWKSNLFYNETGLRIDPVYTNRDILAETIAEAHKHGLHVEAWFEYGFVGWWNGDVTPPQKGGIFTPHPNWVARTKSGRELDNSSFYWMVQTRKDVQDFLIGLTTEICRNYDIDGIELDRVRYSHVGYGYDAYTDSLYRFENNNTPLPADSTNAQFLRWRADKINLFMKRAYDSIKAANPHVLISNAPSLYSSSSYTAYNEYCQDWVYWVNNNFVDYVQLQMYVSPWSTFSSIVNFAISMLQNKSKLYPAVAVNMLSTQELGQYITGIRNLNLKGVALWYSLDLPPYFSSLRTGSFVNKTDPPLTEENRRAFYHVVTLKDTAKIKYNGAWQQSTLTGYSGGCMQAASGNLSTVSYSADVPADGYYEVYAYQVTATNRTDSAAYTIYFNTGDSTMVYVNQSNTNNKRFIKLGDFYLKKGLRQILSVSNKKVKANTFINTDALMISLNRRLSPDATNAVDNGNTPALKKKGLGFNLKCYPNPTNSDNVITFTLPENKPYSVRIYSVEGKEIFSKIAETPQKSENILRFGYDNLTTGVYFCTIQQNTSQETIKFVVLK
ncbi:MAG: family 10 glycosylhydrolase [Ignavibacteriales bacterium]|nr:family 10 glycosylhydrolase [Ignavibacteriales bacterium]